MGSELMQGLWSLLTNRHAPIVRRDAAEERVIRHDQPKDLAGLSETCQVSVIQNDR
jgi:hypothetical protein